MKEISLLIITYNGKYLLFKRSELNHTFKNFYGLIGGGVNKNETPEEAIMRETQEEAGLKLININKLKKYKYDGKLLNVYYTEIDNIDEIELSPEHTSFKEFTLEEITDNPEVIPTTIKMINDYLDKSNIIKELYGSTDGNDDILSDDGNVFDAMRYNGGTVDAYSNQLSIDESGTDRYTSDNNVGGDQFQSFDVNHYNDNKDNFSNDEILERRTAWINGSKGVEVKQKCRLGGGTACNQGDINNLIFTELSLDEEFLGDVEYVDSMFEIYKNPTKLNKIQSDIRGIIDSKTGDLYVVDGKYWLLHREISKLLNKKLNTNFPVDWMGIYESPNILIPVQRLKNTNKFGLGELYSLTKHQDLKTYTKIIFPSITKVLELARQKNPNIEFIDKVVDDDDTDMVNEEFDPSDGYTDDNVLDAIIDGSKGSGTIMLTPSMKEKIIKNKLNLIKVMPPHHNIYIVYKDQRDKALKIYNYLKLRGGYFNNRTPEEAWEMGKLLDYTEDSIKKFIKRTYVDKKDIYGKPFPESKFPKDLVVDPKFIDEDMSDKFAEKRFRIKPEFDDFEKHYNKKVAIEQNEDIIWKKDEYFIMKNPKTLENIDTNVRGIIDENGNLYVININNFTHDIMLRILNKLRIIDLVDNWWILSPLKTKYITVERNGISNNFMLGESTISMTPEEKRKDNFISNWGDKKIPSRDKVAPEFQLYLDKAKIKNPRYTFTNELINDWNIMNESSDESKICKDIKITPEIHDYILKFDSDEKLLRSGGIPTNLLDIAAYGFNEELIKKMMPKHLNIKWKDDLRNAIYKQEKSGLSKIDWAKQVNLTEPIDVSYNGKKFYVEDGHHRYYAAKILNVPLNINLEIKENPIKKLDGIGDYDNFHRCLWKQVHRKNEIEEGVGDKYGEKLGIPDEDKIFNTLYNSSNQKNIELPVGVSYGKRSRKDIEKSPIQIYKNPRSLKNFENDVRAIGTVNGDLYVAIFNGEINHRDIGKAIGLNNYNVYDEPKVYVLLHRIKNTNSFGLSDMSEEAYESHYKEEIENILRNVKKHNPEYIFYTSYYDNTYKGDPISIDNKVDILNEDIEIPNTVNDFINILNSKPFIKELINNGGDLYVVGGATRDLILNKPNKDIDLVVRKISIDNLVTILEKFGKVDIVGKSFGVLKFIDSDGLDYDVALPRKEKSNGEGGYRGFEIQSDENLPIESDLIRRDININAMAININTGKFIDPLGGLKDIENKVVSAANPEAFSDDPLRMLRCISFSSRFGFDIDPSTMKMIQDNASRIKEIPADRILIELQKIVKKGNLLTGAILLDRSGLYQEIFGKSPYYDFENNINFNKVKTLGEYMFLLLNNTVGNPDIFFKNILHGDNDSYNEIRSYILAYNNSKTVKNNAEARGIAHNMYKISTYSIESEILPQNIKKACTELLNGLYPKTTVELAVNGDDLMQLGLKGKEIGDTQKSLLISIYGDKVKNNKEDLVKLINNKPIVESILTETIKGGEYIMYHGSNHLFDKFTDEYVDKKDAIEQEGPGIYFTTLLSEAERYGKYIYKVKLTPRKLTDTTNKRTVSVANISNLIKMSPTWKDDVLNFDYPIIKGLASAIKSMIDYSENEKDLYQQIWIDFFKYNPQLFVRGMVKLGFDGQLIKKEYEDAIHIIVYNPNIIEILEVIDNTENLNEIENKSKYSKNKESLLGSRSISKEMKENILKYFGGGSTYHEGGHVRGLIKPESFTKKTPKSEGVSLGADKKGIYCYTHRARSASYLTPEQIPIKDIEFIESTG